MKKARKCWDRWKACWAQILRCNRCAEDIVTHYEKYRANLLTGKAMIVAYSRPIAMKIYRKLLELRPAWKEKIGVVMTSGNNDPEDWKAIIGTKSHQGGTGAKVQR